MKSLILATVLGVCLAACAVQNTTLTPAEEEWLEGVDSVQTTFRLPADVSDIAWDRAQHFIERHSAVTIEHMSSSVIRTFNPQLGTRRCGYVVHRQPIDEDVEFDVECVVGDPIHMATGDRNARLLAHYMKTGELPVNPRKLIAR